MTRFPFLCFSELFEEWLSPCFVNLNTVQAEACWYQIRSNTTSANRCRDNFSSFGVNQLYNTEREQASSSNPHSCMFLHSDIHPSPSWSSFYKGGWGTTTSSWDIYHMKDFLTVFLLILWKFYNKSRNDKYLKHQESDNNTDLVSLVKSETFSPEIGQGRNRNDEPNTVPLFDRHAPQLTRWERTSVYCPLLTQS